MLACRLNSSTLRFQKPGKPPRRAQRIGVAHIVVGLCVRLNVGKQYGVERDDQEGNGDVRGLELTPELAACPPRLPRSDWLSSSFVSLVMHHFDDFTLDEFLVID
jgi:hypothetical protein